MNPLRTLCLMATCLLATVYATHSRNSISNNLKPSEWMSMSELESLPAVNEINMEKLQEMSTVEGAELINKLYHLSQISLNVEPSYVPKPSEIPCFIAQRNGQRVNFNLDELVATAKQQRDFGEEEVTVFITGLPQRSRVVKKATEKLVRAYMQRYNGQEQQRQEQRQNKKQNDDNDSSDSSEENNDNQQSKPSGNLVVINLGETLDKFERFALLDIEKTGAMLGNILVDLTNEADVPQEIIKLIGQGISAHVAGAAGNQYTRLTGHKIRRITALDPSKIFARKPNTLTGLARGDADFVDAIHTSAYGMGTATRVGDADFYPNGPAVGVPGADNVVEASMRATRYYAETVRPGNERNFPAVAANSLKQYKNNNGNGPRVYMGINTEFDVEGDYILQVNSKEPFGKAAAAQNQNHYHAAHKSWNSKSDLNSLDY